MHRPKNDEKGTSNRSNPEAGQNDELFTPKSAAQFDAIMDEVVQSPNDSSAYDDFDFPEYHLNSFETGDEPDLPEDTLPEMDLILANETIL
jgi:hypothetical protein